MDGLKMSDKDKLDEIRIKRSELRKKDKELERLETALTEKFMRTELERQDDDCESLVGLCLRYENPESAHFPHKMLLYISAHPSERHIEAVYVDEYEPRTGCMIFNPYGYDGTDKMLLNMSEVTEKMLSKRESFIRHCREVTRDMFVIRYKEVMKYIDNALLGKETV